MFINNLLIFFTLGTLILLFFVERWQMRIAALAILYLISFVIIVQIWPIALASVKLIAGWIAMVIMSTSQMPAAVGSRPLQIRSRSIFNVLTTAMIWIVLMAIAPRLLEWLPIPYTNLFIGLSMAVSGIILSSITANLSRMLSGVLVLLNGFDVIYSSLEGSALVTAIFALIVIAIAFLDLYFQQMGQEVFD